MPDPDANDLTPQEQAALDAFEEMPCDPAEAVVTFLPRVRRRD